MISHFSIKDFKWCLIVQIWVKLILLTGKKSKFSTGKIATCNKIKLMLKGKMGESEHGVYYFSACHSSYREESFSCLSKFFGWSNNLTKKRRKKSFCRELIKLWPKQTSFISNIKANKKYLGAELSRQRSLSLGSKLVKQQHFFIQPSRL